MLRKTLNIPLHVSDKYASLNSVQLCEISIKHYLLAADEQDKALDLFERDK
jgi:hypothetical protein